MPRHHSPGWVPTYRHHKSSGHAYVAIAGGPHYLGDFGTSVSQAICDRLIAEWVTRHRRSSTPDCTVADAG